MSRQENEEKNDSQILDFNRKSSKWIKLNENDDQLQANYYVGVEIDVSWEAINCVVVVRWQQHPTASNSNWQHRIAPLRNGRRTIQTARYRKWNGVVTIKSVPWRIQIVGYKLSNEPQNALVPAVRLFNGATANCLVCPLLTPSSTTTKSLWTESLLRLESSLLSVTAQDARVQIWNETCLPHQLHHHTATTLVHYSCILPHNCMTLSAPLTVTPWSTDQGIARFIIDRHHKKPV